MSLNKWENYIIYGGEMPDVTEDWNPVPMPDLRTDGKMDFDKAGRAAEALEAKRAHNFKTANPETCPHNLVYNKDGNDMHCHYCDKFMYDESKD